MSQKIELILAPSTIHGVGVFAYRAFKKGEKLPLFAKGDRVLVKSRKGLEKRYSCKWKNGYDRPSNWHRMSIGWYLNGSKTPNVELETWRALRDIKWGEELTIDYSPL